MAKETIKPAPMEAQTVTKKDVGVLDVAALFNSLPALPVAPDEDAIFDTMTTSGEWLPRLQMNGSSAKLAKKRKVQVGDWTVHTTKDDYQNLGQNVVCFVAYVLGKATDLSDGTVKTTRDANSELFKHVQQCQKELTGEDAQGYMWGPEYLLWVPAIEGPQKFATYHAGSKSARRSAKTMKPLMRLPARFSHTIVETEKWTFEVPVFSQFAGEMPPFTRAEFDKAFAIFEGKAVASSEDDEEEAAVAAAVADTSRVR